MVFENGELWEKKRKKNAQIGNEARKKHKRWFFMKG
jgi:hypothetical protein